MTPTNKSKAWLYIVAGALAITLGIVFTTGASYAGLSAGKSSGSNRQLGGPTIGTGTATGTGTGVVTGTTTGTPIATGSATGSVTGTGTPQPGCTPTAEVPISITEGGFVPSSVTVNPGTRITWTNNGTNRHRVRDVGHVLFDSDDLQPGQSFSYTFCNPGTYNYEDTRSNFTGVVIVTGATGTGTVTGTVTGTTTGTPSGTAVTGTATGTAVTGTTTGTATGTVTGTTTGTVTGTRTGTVTGTATGTVTGTATGTRTGTAVTGTATGTRTGTAVTGTVTGTRTGTAVTGTTTGTATRTGTAVTGTTTGTATGTRTGTAVTGTATGTRTGTAVVSVTGTASASASATGTGTVVVPNRVSICHRTSSPRNPYVEIEVSSSALSAHQQHGDLYPVPAGGCPAGAPHPNPNRFSDVLPPDYFYDRVLDLAQRDAISGYADGTFKPYNFTTRAQLVKIVVLGLNIPMETDPTPRFTDVPADHPFFEYIQTAAIRGLISGYDDGTFRPYNLVTRGQIAKIVTIGAEMEPVEPGTPSFSDVPVSHTFYRDVETAYANGIIGGYSCGGPGEPCDEQNRPYFRPFATAVRAHVAKMVDLATHP